jgi:DMSO/TMAO reductase YedYZ molybdopterin-dependent catalytic subunit
MLYASYTPRPSPDDPNLYVFKAPIGTGHFAFVELAQYAKYTRWVLDNPSRSVGRTISLAPYATSLKDIVEAFEKVTGKRAKGEMLGFDEWWRGPDLRKKIPWSLSVSGEEEDDTRFTIKQSLGAFIDIWGKTLLFLL